MKAERDCVNPMIRDFSPERLSNVTYLNKREAEALLLMDEYEDRDEVAEEMGISPIAVHGLIEDCRKESDKAARTVEAVRELHGHRPNL